MVNNKSKSILYSNNYTFLGFPNGKCIKSSLLNTTKVCEVFAWCPVENSIENINNMIGGILNYTIFVRNNIEFEKFDKKEY